ncbi:hypothetical protein Clacol_002530 [Clathrus columnatus]|uniref:Obg-like ATPase homolog n=1 Tax=Clathrus columnatus TaxID=1419009 RepID=A0AAV5A6F1_9AGAM|nr:hypothetical protein Clacol_002530 [Clathrus columnatus]
MHLITLCPTLRPEIIEALEANSVSTVEELFAASLDELYQKLPANIITIQQLKQLKLDTKQKLSTLGIRASELLVVQQKKEQQREKCYCGIKCLDDLLGGFGNYGVIEVMGSKGSGRTGLVLNIVLRHLSSHPRHKAIWFDIGGEFDIERTSMISNLYAKSTTSETILDFFSVIPCFEVTTVYEYLQGLEKTLEKESHNAPTRIIVIDSLAQLLAPLLTASSQGHAVMTMLMRRLTYLARTYSLTVLVINAMIQQLGKGKMPLSTTKPGSALDASFTFLTDETLWLSIADDRITQGQKTNLALSGKTLFKAQVLRSHNNPSRNKWCYFIMQNGLALESFDVDTSSHELRHRLGVRVYFMLISFVADCKLQVRTSFLHLHALFSTTPVRLIKRRMPPKKAASTEKKALLGRPSNNLKIGIVGKFLVSTAQEKVVTNSIGLPNVGKSSFFNVLSQTDLGKAANFPYATINPEEARIPVPDTRFDWLCDVYKPASRVPAFLTCIDIAGLTAGASTGAGLGNAFLSHVRAVDGIFQVVRAFDDAEVIHVEGDVDPLRDMEIIQRELQLKDIEWVEKALEASRKLGRSLGTSSLAGRQRAEEIATQEKILKLLKDEGRDVRKGDWNNKEIDVVNSLSLLTAKPVTYLVNLSEKDYIRKKNKWLPKIKGWIDEHNPGDPLIPFSVALEERLQALEPEEREEEQKKIGATSALGKINHAGYSSLDLIRYFTCGPDEVRAWTIRKGTKAPQAAGVIHSDFENKFVCGEIMSYDDLKEHGSETAVKAAGKLRQQGKPYEMVDGDIAYWKSG